ncbi:MAG: M56 family metallopeptidase [Chloroflexota bacterium]
MDFPSSAIGQYVLQTYLHSVIIAIVIEAIIAFWHLQRPRIQVRFRLLVLLPGLYLPLFNLLYPPRSGIFFHQAVAIFDFSQWLRLRLVGGLALWHLLAAMLALTALYFLLREAIPTARHYLGHHHRLPTVNDGQFPKLDSVLDSLSRHRGFPKPLVLLSPEAHPIIYTMDRRRLVLSASVINTLDTDELEAVIAHELAHFTREIYITGWICLVLRFLTFYNPVALIVFRRIINDSEKTCDDMAIATTGKRLALASGLLKVFLHSAATTQAAIPSEDDRWLRLSPRLSALEDRASRELLKERVERTLHPEEDGVSHPNPRLAATAILLATLLFFVV